MQNENDAMGAIIGASTDASARTYRLAFGPKAGPGAPAAISLGLPLRSDGAASGTVTG
jgi:hypothetical protein